MKRRGAGAAALLALCLWLGMKPAAAQPIDGIYVGGAGGLNFIQTERLREVNVGGTHLGSPGPAYQTGYAGLGSVGYAFGNGVRVEIEGSYRYNDSGSGKLAAGVSNTSGHESKYGAMGNVLFDLDIGSPYVYPYLGAGLGYQNVEQNQTQTGLPGAPGSTLHVSGTKGGFAYQGMLGLGFPIPGVVGLSATAEYRYLGMTGNRSYSGSVTSAAAVTPATRRITQDNNHSILIGLRFAFDVPPPPPPPAAAGPAPAPAPARSYLVFFDWDRADLTTRARQIIAEAAQASTRVATTRIDVAGYADTSGSPAYNQKLSMRRADSVAAELVKDGVPQSVIAISAFGDTKLLVPTGPGVREPQNRRVEIVLK